MIVRDNVKTHLGSNRKLDQIDDFPYSRLASKTD